MLRARNLARLEMFAVETGNCDRGIYNQPVLNTPIRIGRPADDNSLRFGATENSVHAEPVPPSSVYVQLANHGLNSSRSNGLSFRWIGSYVQPLFAVQVLLHV